VLDEKLEAEIPATYPRLFSVTCCPPIKLRLHYSIRRLGNDRYFLGLHNWLVEVIECIMICFRESGHFGLQFH
jgi:hypothetical protein